MEDERVATVGVDQPIFCPPAQTGDLRAGEPLAKVFGQGPAQVRPSRLDSRQAASLQDLLQAADRGFDFGKLRHSCDMAEAGQPR